MTGGGTTAWGRTLPRAFFDRDVEAVARDLLGRVLVDDGPDGRVGVRLVEVEAYAGLDDPASHAFRGRTRRTEVMFGPPGHLYVYFVYGMHWCANVVTGPDGHASAVLLRAGEVVDGTDLAAARRPRARSSTQLARGPAGLATVLGLGGTATGTDLLTGRWRLLAGDPVPAGRVEIGPRVGIAAAADRPLRFWDSASAAVSAYRRGGVSRRRRS